MAKKQMFRTGLFKTPLCRVSFAADLFKARPRGEGASAREKFGATLIFPKAVLDEPVWQMDGGKRMTFTDIVRSAIVGEWGEQGLVRAGNGLITPPYRAGDGKEARNKETGALHPGMGPDVFMIRVQANADRPPVVSSSPTAVIPATPSDVYSGCYGFAVLNLFCWFNKENGDGISAGISSFFKKAEGERLGASDDGNAERWAETVEDAGEIPAAAKSGAGAGGLFGNSSGGVLG